MNAVKRDMARSSVYVEEKVKPVIEELLPFWHMMKVEGRENEVCQLLDMSCGIDYLLHSEQSSLVLGVASRVQYGKNYRTFTVRKDRASGVLTEHQKRTQAISQGGLYPMYSVQSYIDDDGELAGLGIVRTADLSEFISRGLAREKKTGADKIGQAEFYVCTWDKLKYAGYNVLEYPTREKDRQQRR